MAKVIGYADARGEGWCMDHLPNGIESDDDATPLMDSDLWLGDVGLCAEPDCAVLFSDLAR